MANTALSVTGLNFDTIRLNLRNYIASKPEFADYDFADSALGTLLDLLAYNTYYQAFYDNMAASEAFIDSAQFYDSVVSRAKLMGYVPISARGAQANVRVRFSSALANSSHPTRTIAQNSRFTSTINGISYVFVTPSSYTISANSSNMFAQDIELVEGLPLTHRFLFSTSNTAFVLPNENVDTRSISVSITSGANTDTYIQADDINVVNSSSKVFFLEADRDRRYKIEFGDNILGLKPAFNSTVAISYRVCNALRGNGANNFVSVGALAGESAFTLQVLERAVGGAEQEGIESVKFNAPKAYETQNRSVIAADYQRIIKSQNADLEAVNVWGGEDNDPPIFGKTFVAVKPYQGTLISSARKTSIRNAIRRYNVQSIDVEIVDPTILYIVPTITVKYDARLTTLSASQIAAAVATRIITFETNNFARFDSKFWYSKFLAYLDGADNGIVGSSAIIDLQKRFKPSTTQRNDYTFKFNAALQSLGVADSTVQNNIGFGFMSSTSFTFQEFTSFFDDNGYGLLRTYYQNSALSRIGRVYNNLTAGSINYVSGTVVLSSFLPSAFSGTEMKISVRPVNPSVQAVRNQLLFFSDASVSVSEISSGATATLTSIATAGQSTTINETGIQPLTVF